MFCYALKLTVQKKISKLWKRDRRRDQLEFFRLRYFESLLNFEVNDAEICSISLRNKY